MYTFFQNIGQTGSMALILMGSILFGSIIHVLLIYILRKIAQSTKTALDNLFISRISGSFWLLFPLLSFSLSVTIFNDTFPDEAMSIVLPITRILYIISFAWLLLGLVSYLQDFLLQRYQLDVADNLQARRMFTQISIIRKLVTVVVVLLAFASVLMQFETLRYIGTGILASAGVAGIIIGFAAQKTIGNLLAGFQIAITQPIRIDDVVVVEGEWGRIEEITLTYVVVRIWDLRRLVLPISYFIEKPFQNWTRESAEILGSVYMHLDYTAPVDAIRDRLHTILKESKNWDGKVCRLQVTDTTEKTMQLRALMSAENSGAAWDLRCEVREKLVAFMKAEHPQCLPTFRAWVTSSDRCSIEGYDG
jgi:small-conductance mechanosensitive channel